MSRACYYFVTFLVYPFFCIQFVLTIQDYSRSRQIRSVLGGLPGLERLVENWDRVSCALCCWPAAVLPPRCVSPGGRSMHAHQQRQAAAKCVWLVGWPRFHSTPRLSMGGRAVPGPHGQKQSSKRKATEETEKRPPACPQPFRSIRARARSVALGREEGIIIAMAAGGPLACSASQPNRLDPAAPCVRGAWRDADAALQLHHVSRGPRRGRWPPTTAWFAGPAGDLSRGRTNDGVRVKAHWSRVRFIYYYECVPL